MPSVTLRYTLPDEQGEYDAARQGSEALALLHEIDQRCRSLIKYNDNASEDARRLAEEIRQMIGESKVDLG